MAFRVAHRHQKAGAKPGPAAAGLCIRLTFGQRLRLAAPGFDPQPQQISSASVPDQAKQPF